MSNQIAIIDDPPRTRQPVVKAGIIGRQEIEPSNLSSQTQDSFFAGAVGSITPPIDYERACFLHDQGLALRSCIDAYAAGIDAGGHSFVPRIHLDHTDANDEIAEAMYIERSQADVLGVSSDDGHGGEDPTKSDLWPSEEEVGERKEKMRVEMRAELAKVKNFFNHAVRGSSFKTLRKHHRMDYELLGNAYWEMLRNKRDVPAEIKLAPAYSIRVADVDRCPVEVEETIRAGLFGFTEIKVMRYFKRFMQFTAGDMGSSIYFKEYGDPRTYSARSGQQVSSPEALGPGDPAATELLHWALYHPKYVYGYPRWGGAYLLALSMREADEVNWKLFKNNSIPQMAIIVEGGSLPERTLKRVQEFVESNIKGQFHKLLYLAIPYQVGAPPGSQLRVKLQPLQNQQTSDGLFMKFTERGLDNVARQFRLPRILCGNSIDQNKSTVEFAIRLAENMVFASEREEFDSVIDSQIMIPLRIKYWGYRSNPLKWGDTAELVRILTETSKQGLTTANEARKRISGELAGEELPPIDEPWANEPLQYSITKLNQGMVDVKEQADRMLELRDAFRSAVVDAEQDEYTAAERDGRVIDISPEQWAALNQPEPESGNGV